MKSIIQILLLGLIILAGNVYSQSEEKKEIRIKVENDTPDKTYHVKVVTEKDGTEKVYEKTYGSLEEMESDSTISIHVSGDREKTLNIKVEKFPEGFNWTAATDSVDHQVFKTEGGNFVIINKEGDEPGLEFFSEADSGKMVQSYQIRIVKEGESGDKEKLINKEMLVLKDDEGNISIQSGSEGKEMIWIEKENVDRHKNHLTKSPVNEARIQDLTVQDEDFSDFNIAGLPVLKLKSLNYYPNPNEGEFTLSFSSTRKPVIVRILDQSGNLMYEETLNDFSGYYNEVMNVKEFETGHYLLQVHQQGKVLNKKLILE